MLATLPRMLLACGMLLLLLCSTGAPGDGHSCSSALSFPLAVITLLCAPATSLLSALVPNGPIMQVQAVISGDYTDPVAFPMQATIDTTTATVKFMVRIHAMPPSTVTCAVSMRAMSGNQPADIGGITPSSFSAPNPGTYPLDTEITYLPDSTPYPSTVISVLCPGYTDLVIPINFMVDVSGVFTTAANAYVTPPIWGGGNQSALPGYRNGAIGQALFNHMAQAVMRPSGDALLIADAGNNVIRRVNFDSDTVETLWGPTPAMSALPYMPAASPTSLPSSPYPLVTVNTTASFRTPYGLALSGDGERLFVGDMYNCRVLLLQHTSGVPTSLKQISGGTGCVGTTIVEGAGDDGANYLPYPGSMVFDTLREMLYVLVNAHQTGSSTLGCTLMAIDTSSPSFAATALTAMTKSGFAAAPFQYDTVVEPSPAMGYIPTLASLALSNDASALYILSPALAPIGASPASPAPTVLRILNLAENNTLNTILSSFYSPSLPVFGQILDGTPVAAVEHTLPLMGGPTAAALHPDGELLYFIDSGMRVDTTYAVQPMLCNAPLVNGSEYPYVDCESSIRSLNLLTGEVRTLAGGFATNSDGVGSQAGLWSGNRDGRTMFGDLMPTRNSLLMHPNGRSMYVLEGTANSRLRQFFFATNELRTISGGGGLAGVASASAPARIFGNRDGFGTDALYSSPYALDMSKPDGRYLWVTDSLGVSRIDTTTSYSRRVHLYSIAAARAEPASVDPSTVKIRALFPIASVQNRPDVLYGWQKDGSNALKFYRLDATNLTNGGEALVVQTTGDVMDSFILPDVNARATAMVHRPGTENATGPGEMFVALSGDNGGAYSMLVRMFFNSHDSYDATDGTLTPFMAQGLISGMAFDSTGEYLYTLHALSKNIRQWKMSEYEFWAGSSLYIDIVPIAAGAFTDHRMFDGLTDADVGLAFEANAHFQMEQRWAESQFYSGETYTSTTILPADSLRGLHQLVVAADNSALYFTDMNRAGQTFIRQITPETPPTWGTKNTVKTVAGGGGSISPLSTATANAFDLRVYNRSYSSTMSWASGMGATAGITGGRGLAMHPITGMLFVADYFNHHIRAVLPYGLGAVTYSPIILSCKPPVGLADSVTTTSVTLTGQNFNNLGTVSVQVVDDAGTNVVLISSGAKTLTTLVFVFPNTAGGVTANVRYRFRLWYSSMYSPASSASFMLVTAASPSAPQIRSVSPARSVTSAVPGTLTLHGANFGRLSGDVSAVHWSETATYSATVAAVSFTRIDENRIVLSITATLNAPYTIWFQVTMAGGAAAFVARNANVSFTAAAPAPVITSVSPMQTFQTPGSVTRVTIGGDHFGSQASDITVAFASNAGAYWNGIAFTQRCWNVALVAQPLLNRTVLTCQLPATIPVANLTTHRSYDVRVSVRGTSSAVWPGFLVWPFGSAPSNAPFYKQVAASAVSSLQAASRLSSGWVVQPESLAPEFSPSTPWLVLATPQSLSLNDAATFTPMGGFGLTGSALSSLASIADRPMPSLFGGPSFALTVAFSANMRNALFGTDGVTQLGARLFSCRKAGATGFNPPDEISVVWDPDCNNSGMSCFRFRMRITDSTSVVRLWGPIPTPEIYPDRPVHYALTLSRAGVIRWWINGVSQPESMVGQSESLRFGANLPSRDILLALTTRTCRVGSDDDPPNYDTITGAVAQLRFWTRELSATEMLALASHLNQRPIEHVNTGGCSDTSSSHSSLPSSIHFSQSAASIFVHLSSSFVSTMGLRSVDVQALALFPNKFGTSQLCDSVAAISDTCFRCTFNAGDYPKWTPLQVLMHAGNTVWSTNNPDETVVLSNGATPAALIASEAVAVWNITAQCLTAGSVVHPEFTTSGTAGILTFTSRLNSTLLLTEPLHNQGAVAGQAVLPSRLFDSSYAGFSLLMWVQLLSTAPNQLLLELWNATSGSANNMDGFTVRVISSYDQTVWGLSPTSNIATASAPANSRLRRNQRVALLFQTWSAGAILCSVTSPNLNIGQWVSVGYSHSLNGRVALRMNGANVFVSNDVEFPATKPALCPVMPSALKTTTARFGSPSPTVSPPTSAALPGNRFQSFQGRLAHLSFYTRPLENHRPRLFPFNVTGVFSELQHIAMFVPGSMPQLDWPESAGGQSAVMAGFPRVFPSFQRVFNLDVAIFPPQAPLQQDWHFKSFVPETGALLGWKPTGVPIPYGSWYSLDHDLGSRTGDASYQSLDAWAPVLKTALIALPDVTPLAGVVRVESNTSRPFASQRCSSFLPHSIVMAGRTVLGVLRHTQDVGGNGISARAQCMTYMSSQVGTQLISAAGSSMLRDVAGLLPSPLYTVGTALLFNPINSDPTEATSFVDLVGASGDPLLGSSGSFDFSLSQSAFSFSTWFTLDNASFSQLQDYDSVAFPACIVDIGSPDGMSDIVLGYSQRPTDAFAHLHFRVYSNGMIACSIDAFGAFAAAAAGTLPYHVVASASLETGCNLYLNGALLGSDPLLSFDFSVPRPYARLGNCGVNFLEGPASTGILYSFYGKLFSFGWWRNHALDENDALLMMQVPPPNLRADKAAGIVEPLQLLHMTATALYTMEAPTYTAGYATADFCLFAGGCARFDGVGHFVDLTGEPSYILSTWETGFFNLPYSGYTNATGGGSPNQNIVPSILAPTSGSTGNFSTSIYFRLDHTANMLSQYTLWEIETPGARQIFLIYDGLSYDVATGLGGVLRFQLDATSGCSALSDGLAWPIVANRWYSAVTTHTTFLNGDSILNVFLDGVLAGTNTAACITPAAGTREYKFIGRPTDIAPSGVASGSWFGYLSHFALYDLRVLHATEIAIHARPVKTGAQRIDTVAPATAALGQAINVTLSASSGSFLFCDPADIVSVSYAPNAAGGVSLCKHVFLLNDHALNCEIGTDVSFQASVYFTVRMRNSIGGLTQAAKEFSDSLLGGVPGGAGLGSLHSNLTFQLGSYPANFSVIRPPADLVMIRMAQLAPDGVSTVPQRWSWQNGIYSNGDGLGYAPAFHRDVHSYSAAFPWLTKSLGVSAQFHTPGTVSLYRNSVFVANLVSNQTVAVPMPQASNFNLPTTVYLAFWHSAEGWYNVTILRRAQDVTSVNLQFFDEWGNPAPEETVSLVRRVNYFRNETFDWPVMVPRYVRSVAIAFRYVASYQPYVTIFNGSDGSGGLMHDGFFFPPPMSGMTFSNVFSLSHYPDGVQFRINSTLDGIYSFGFSYMPAHVSSIAVVCSPAPDIQFAFDTPQVYRDPEAVLTSPALNTSLFTRNVSVTTNYYRPVIQLRVVFDTFESLGSPWSDLTAVNFTFLGQDGAWFIASQSNISSEGNSSVPVGATTLRMTSWYDGDFFIHLTRRDYNFFTITIFPTSLSFTDPSTHQFLNRANALMGAGIVSLMPAIYPFGVPYDADTHFYNFTDSSADILPYTYSRVAMSNTMRFIGTATLDFPTLLDVEGFSDGVEQTSAFQSFPYRLNGPANTSRIVGDRTVTAMHVRNNNDGFYTVLVGRYLPDVTSIQWVNSRVGFLSAANSQADSFFTYGLTNAAPLLIRVPFLVRNVSLNAVWNTAGHKVLACVNRLNCAWTTNALATNAINSNLVFKGFSSGVTSDTVFNLTMSNFSSSAHTPQQFELQNLISVYAQRDGVYNFAFVRAGADVRDVVFEFLRRDGSRYTLLATSIVDGWSPKPFFGNDELFSYTLGSPLSSAVIAVRVGVSYCTAYTNVSASFPDSNTTVAQPLAIAPGGGGAPMWSTASPFVNLVSGLNRVEVRSDLDGLYSFMLNLTAPALIGPLQLDAEIAAGYGAPTPLDVAQNLQADTRRFPQPFVIAQYPEQISTRPVHLAFFHVRLAWIVHGFSAGVVLEGPGTGVSRTLSPQVSSPMLDLAVGANAFWINSSADAASYPFMIWRQEPLIARFDLGGTPALWSGASDVDPIGLVAASRSPFTNVLADLQWNNTIYQRVFFVRYHTHSVHINLTWNAWARDPTAAALETLSFKPPVNPLVSVPVAGSGARVQNIRTAGVGTHSLLLNSSTSDGAYNVLVVKKRLDLQDISLATSLSPNASVSLFNSTAAPLEPSFVVGDFAAFTVYVANISLPYAATNKTFAYFRVNFSTSASVSASFGPASNPELMQFRPSVGEEQPVDGRAADFQAALNSGASAATLLASYTALAGSPTSAFSYFSTLGLGPLQDTGMNSPYILRVNSSEDGDGYELRLYVTILPQIIPPSAGFFNVSHNFTAMYQGESNTVTVFISRPPQTSHGLTLVATIANSSAVLATVPLTFGAIGWTNTSNNASFVLMAPSWAPQTLTISFAIVRANLTNEMDIAMAADSDLYTFVAPPSFTVPVLTYPAFSWGGYPANPCLCNPNPLSGTCSEGLFGSGLCTCSSAFNGSTCSVCSTTIPRVGVNCLPLSGFFNVSRGNLTTIYSGEVSSPITVSISRSPLTPNGLRLQVTVSTMGTGAVLSVSELMFGSHSWANATLNASFAVTGPAPAPQVISVSFAVVRANLTGSPVPGSPDFDLFAFVAPPPFTLQILPYPAFSWGGWPARPCLCNSNPLSGSCSEGPLGTGFCNCTVGFNGTTCSQCSAVGGPRAGSNCALCPTCYNGGVCTPGVLSTPVCVCPGNLAGAMCDSCSVPNFFGPQCLTPCPACVVGNGVCSAGTNGTGLCVCNAGWTGTRCEFISGAGLVAISSAWYGVDGGVVPIEIKLNASTPLFSARVLSLPTVGRLFQAAADGRTATAAIISVPAPVTNAQLRLLYFPPTTPSVIAQLADRSTSQDFFTFDVASSLYSYTSSPGRVDLFLLHNNEAPVLTLTSWPSGAVRPVSDTLTVVRMQQGGRLTFRAADATSNLPTVSLRGSDVDSTTNDMLLQMQVSAGVLAFDRSLLVGATVPAALAIDNLLANSSIVPLLSVPSATYAVRAPLTVLNDLLSIVTFVPAASFSGSVSLTVLLGDDGYWSARALGLQRESTSLTDARVLPIEVNQVNQPISIVNVTARFRLRDAQGNVTVYPATTPIPDFLIAGTPSVMLSAALVDPDAYSGFVTVSLAVSTVGSSIRLANLPAAGPTSSAYSQLFVSFSSGTGYAGVKLPTAAAAGPAERTLEFSAPIDKLNLLLSAVIYTPAPDSFGFDTLQVAVSDNGNTCGLVTATNPCIVNTDSFSLGFAIPRREYAPVVADKTETVLEGSSRSTLTLTASDQNAGSLPLAMANVTTEFFLSSLVVRNLTGTTKLNWGVLGRLHQWASAGLGAAILPSAENTLITDASSRVLLKLAPYYFGPGLLNFTFTARKRVEYNGSINYLPAVRNATISMFITHVNHIPYVSNGTTTTIALAAQPALGTLYIQTEFFASGQQNLVGLKGSDLDLIDEPTLRFVIEEVPKKGELYQLNDTAYDMLLLGAAGTASANFSIRGSRITNGGSSVSSRRRAVVYVGPIDDPEILAAQLAASLNPESFNGLVFPMYSNFSYRVVDPYGLSSNPSATISLRLSLPVIPLLEPLNITANQDRDVALVFQPLNSQSYSLNFSAVVIHSLPTRGNLWTRDLTVTDPFESGRGVLIDRVPFRVSASDPVNGASFIPLIYAPPFGQYGQDFDQIKYSVISSRGVESLESELVTITLLKINHPPEANRLSFFGLTDGLEVMVNPPNLLTLSGSDSDGDALTAMIRSLPTTGRLEQVLANGDASGVMISAVPTPVTDPAMRVKYFPNDPLATSPYFDVFAYSISDGLISSAAVSVSLLVHATTLPPVPTSQTVTVAEIDPVGVVVSLEGVDPKNGGSLSFFITTMPSVGTLTQLSGSAVVPGLNIASRNPVTGGRQLLYIPPASRGFGVAFDSFQFGVRDAQGLASTVSATVTVDITHTYQAAVIFGPLVTRYTVDQDTTYNPILLNVTQYDAPQRGVAILTLPAKAGRLFACDAIAFNGVGVEITSAMLPFIAYTCSAAGATGSVSLFYSPAPLVYSDLTTDDGVLESFRWAAFDNTTFASLYIAPSPSTMTSDEKLASDRLVAASPQIATLNLKVNLVNSPPESYGSSYSAALNTPQILQCAGADVRNSRVVRAFIYTMPVHGLLFQVDDARPAEIGAPILLSGDRVTSASGRVRFQPNFAWSGNDTVTFFVVTSLGATLQPGEVDLAADSNVAYSPFNPFTSPIATLNVQVQYSSVPVLVSTIAPVAVELFQNEQAIIRLPSLRLDALAPLPTLVLSVIPALGDLYQLADSATMNWTALVMRESKLHMDGQISAALAALNARRRLLVSGAFGPATALALGAETTTAPDGSVIALSNIDLASFPGPSSWTYDAISSILPPVVFATARLDAVPPSLPNSVQIKNVTFLTAGATVQRITADQLPLAISHPHSLLLYVPQLRQKGSTDEIKFSMPAAAAATSGSGLVIPVTPQTATITLNVRERYLPPSATSFTEVNVLQNEPFVLVLLGINGNDGSTNRITASIDSLPSGGGQLCQITATTPTTPERLAIDRPCGTKYGEPLSRGSAVGDSQLRVVYMPPLNAFGDQLESFDYSIGGRDPDTNILYSASASVMLSVIHVNQPPSTYNVSVVLITPEIYKSASLRYGGRGVSNPVAPGVSPSASTPRSVSILAPQSMYTFPIDSNVTLPLLCNDPDPEDPPETLRYFVQRIRGTKGLVRSHRFTRYTDGSTVLRRDEPLYDFSASGRRTLSDFSQQREIVFDPPIEIGFSGDPNRQSATPESFVAPYLTFEPSFSGGMVGSSVAEESGAFLFIDWFASDHANLNTSIATITFRADCGQNLPGLLATRAAQQQINTSNIAALSASATQVVQLWTNVGSMCGICPSGATCSPTGQYYPLSNDGFWRSDLFDLEGDQGGSDLVYLPCTPTTACVSSPFFLNSSDDACAEGFGSRLCAGCKLDFYFSDGDCKACSDTKTSLMTLLIVGLPVIVVAVALFVALAKLKLTLTWISVLLDLFQIIATLKHFALGWPRDTQSMFEALGVLLVNVDLLQLECQVPAVQYAQKWSIMMLLPLVVILVVAVLSYLGALALTGTNWAAEKSQRRTNQARLAALGESAPLRLRAQLEREHSFTEIIVTSFRSSHNFVLKVSIICLKTLYLTISIKAQEPLKCTRLLDGSLVLDAQPSLSCEDSWYKNMYPWALAATVIYAAGIPVLFAWILFVARPLSTKTRSVFFGWCRCPVRFRKIWEKQAFQQHVIQKRRDAVNGGQASLDNQMAVYRWINTFEGLTEDFNNDSFYWQMVRCARSLSLSVVAIWMGSSPLYQATFALMVLWCALILHLKFAPFRPRTRVNRLESVGLGAAIGIIFVGLLLYSKQTQHTEFSYSWVPTALDITIKVFIACIGLATLSMLNRHFERHGIYDVWRAKCGCGPSSAKKKQMEAERQKEIEMAIIAKRSRRASVVQQNKMAVDQMLKQADLATPIFSHWFTAPAPATTIERRRNIIGWLGAVPGQSKDTQLPDLVPGQGLLPTLPADMQSYLDPVFVGGQIDNRPGYRLPPRPVRTSREQSAGPKEGILSLLHKQSVMSDDWLEQPGSPNAPDPSIARAAALMRNVSVATPPLASPRARIPLPAPRRPAPLRDVSVDAEGIELMGLQPEGQQQQPRRAEPATSLSRMVSAAPRPPSVNPYAASTAASPVGHASYFTGSAESSAFNSPVAVRPQASPSTPAHISLAVHPTPAQQVALNVRDEGQEDDGRGGEPAAGFTFDSSSDEDDDAGFPKDLIAPAPAADAASASAAPSNAPPRSAVSARPMPVMHAAGSQQQRPVPSSRQPAVASPPAPVRGRPLLELLRAVSNTNLSGADPKLRQQMQGLQQAASPSSAAAPASSSASPPPAATGPLAPSEHRRPLAGRAPSAALSPLSSPSTAARPVAPVRPAAASPPARATPLASPSARTPLSPPPAAAAAASASDDLISPSRVASAAALPTLAPRVSRAALRAAGAGGSSALQSPVAARPAAPASGSATPKPSGPGTAWSG